jgi:hypothetical protein
VAIDMTELIQLRANPDERQTEFFFEDIVSCVVGKATWRKNKCNKKISEFVSVSSEAFALLYMLNVASATRHKAGIAMEEEGQHNHPSSTMWTRSSNAGKGEGWTQEGKDEFDRLCDIVVADRGADANVADTNGFEIRFQDTKRQEDGENSKRTRQMTPSDINMTAPYEDAFTDDEEE